MAVTALCGGKAGPSNRPPSRRGRGGGSHAAAKARQAVKGRQTSPSIPSKSHGVPSTTYTLHAVMLYSVPELSCVYYIHNTGNILLLATGLAKLRSATRYRMPYEEMVLCTVPCTEYRLDTLTIPSAPRACTIQYARISRIQYSDALRPCESLLRRRKYHLRLLAST